MFSLANTSCHPTDRARRDTGTYSVLLISCRSGQSDANCYPSV